MNLVSLHSIVQSLLQEETSPISGFKNEKKQTKTGKRGLTLLRYSILWRSMAILLGFTVFTFCIEIYDSHHFIKKFEIVLKFFMTMAGDEP